MSNIEIISVCITIWLVFGVIAGIILIIMEVKWMEWTAVFDAEPKNNDVYLISWYGYILGNKTRSFVEIAEYDGAWILDHIERRGYKDIRVTAWMHLPRPYKEGNDGQT